MTPQPVRTRSWLSLALILAVVVGGQQAWSWWRNTQAAEQVRTLSQTGSVLMFTTDTCPYCAKARAWLNGNEARWRECNIDREPACRRLFEAQGSPGVPLMRVNGQWRLGFDPVWVGQALQSSPSGSSSPRP